MAHQVSERELRKVLDAYRKANGNKTNAADLLGMNRSTFYNRLQMAFREFGEPEVGGAPINVLTDDLLREALDVYKKASGNKQRAADMLGMKRSAFAHRLKVAMNRFGNRKPEATPDVYAPEARTMYSPEDPEIYTPDAPEIYTSEDERKSIQIISSAEDTEIGILRSTIRQLETQIKSFNRDILNEENIRRQIYKISNLPIDQPEWLIKPSRGSGSTGVPTLFASDWHWGEIVDPNQINGVNRYNMTIAQNRAWELINRTINLLKNHINHKDYPGIVFALGGDMVSGDIHDELSASNEAEIMPVIKDIVSVLIWCISTLADHFGRVFVPCVTGNHGRTTHKIRAKGRNFTSFDWNIYNSLERYFANDHRVTFKISDGSDCHYRLYGHRYLLTHGDQFRGGDGMIGAIGPIIRGDHKKRSRNGQIDMGYDTLLIGHWHQLMQYERVIVNGSLKGYDEYAYQGNFSFEPPRQALWITHEEHGITFSTPVVVDKITSKPHKGWLSFKKDNPNLVEEDGWVTWK